MPKNLKLIGYARSKLSDEDLHSKIRDHLKGDDKTKDDFLSRVTYVQGSYDGDEGFQVQTRFLAVLSSCCTTDKVSLETSHGLACQSAKNLRWALPAKPDATA